VAESNIEKNIVTNSLPMDESIPVNLLAAIFKDKNQSYKLFWFKAIIDVVCEGKTVIKYDDLLNRMIAEAWYMVMEFHLNLGPADAIEIMINKLSQIQNLKSTEKKESIISFLNESTDINIKEAKNKLVLNVPYRLQAPFLGKLTESEWRNVEFVSNLASQNKRMLYYYERLKDRSMQIRINEIWISYIKKNVAILKGWIQNEMIHYLQRRNPNVPGIPFKLSPPEKRDLKSATEFWKATMENYAIQDIYTGKTLNSSNVIELGCIAIDHFIPWSYVASDEMWNLTPTFSSVNSSKSNFLPGREDDINKLAIQHYKSFLIANENKEMMKLFQKFKKKHLNSYDIENKLYRKDISEGEFSQNLISIVKPVYLSASNMGFGDWNKRIYEQNIV
jgi:hypothetical protein